MLLMATLIALAAVGLAHAVEPPVRHCPTAADVMHGASQLCSGSSIAESLSSVGVLSDAKMGTTEVPMAAQVLQDHGFRSALDLRLLQPGTAEAAELMEKLRLGGVTIADRSKVRLFIEEPGGGRAASGVAAGASQRSVGRWLGAVGKAGARQPRQLQGSGNSGSGNLSMDTIAIVLSVAVGTAGYAIQAFTARQAEKANQAQAREQQAQESKRQREHEEMLAQVRRTERWVDQCCVPAYQAIQCYMRSRQRFIGSLGSKLQANQPDVFAEIYQGNPSSLGIQVAEDGVITGPPWLLSSGATLALLFDPKSTSDLAITASAPTATASKFSNCSKEGIEIAASDDRALFRKPYVLELPNLFVHFMAADLEGPIAEEYRNYIRHQVKPCLDRFTGIMHAHFAAMELPSLEWLIQNFPEHSKVESTNNIVTDMLAYTKAWDPVLVEWDQGRLESLFPRGHYMPYLVLRKALSWSRERGEAKQEELIGISAGHKNSSATLLDRLQGKHE